MIGKLTMFSPHKGEEQNTEYSLNADRHVALVVADVMNRNHAGGDLPYPELFPHFIPMK